MTHRFGKGKYLLPQKVASSILSGYERAKIVFQRTGPRKTIPHQANVPVNVPPGGLEILGKKYMVIDDRVPFKCHIMTGDYADQTTQNIPMKDKLQNNVWTSPDYLMLWPHNGALPWKVDAQYNDGKGWKHIPNANIKDPIKHPSKPGLQKVHLDFSMSAVKPSAKTPVDMKLTVKCSGPSLYLGWGGGSPHILLCSGMVRDYFGPANVNRVQPSDAVHEIGHGLGLLNMPPAAAGAHNAWADPGNVHHCSKPPKQCAMFPNSSTTRITKFHSTGGTGCNEYLRTQDFSRTKMTHWK